MVDTVDKTIAISGSSGLVGTRLSALMADRGWEVIPITRHRDEEGIFWSVDEDAVDIESLAGLDAVVHLAGENIAGQRWSKAHKKELIRSRVQGTQLLTEAIASLSPAERPEVFICASAVGFYGHRGQEWVDEDSDGGAGFLADLCRDWEAACEPARSADVRVVNTRFGLIISEQGGALEKMLTPFKLGIGGRLGSGDQYMSWVSLQDVVRAIKFIIGNDALRGPVNITSPNPVQNSEFTDILGDALSRPTVLPVPGPMLKLAVGGEMAEEMLLNGQRVRPTRLLDEGFEFKYADLKQALSAAL